MLPRVLLAVSVVLSGCGASHDKPATQVVAKVNKEEISIHQINHALQRTPGVTSEAADAAGRQIPERLISQELAVHKAQTRPHPGHRAGHDRKPIKTEAEMKTPRAAAQVQLVGKFADSGTSAVDAASILAKGEPAPSTPASAVNGLDSCAGPAVTPSKIARLA